MQFYLMTEQNVQRGVATLYIVDDMDVVEITYLDTQKDIKILSVDTKKATQNFRDLSQFLTVRNQRDAKPVITALSNFSLDLLRQVTSQ